MVVHSCARRVLPRRQISVVLGANRTGVGTSDAVRLGASDPMSEPAHAEDPDPVMRSGIGELAMLLDLPPWTPSAQDDPPLDPDELDDLRRLEADVTRLPSGAVDEDRAQLLRVLYALLHWTGVWNVGRSQLVLIAATLSWFVPLWRPVWRGPGSLPDDLGAARALVATLCRNFKRHDHPSIRLPFPPFRDVMARVGEPERRTLRERLTQIDEQLELLAFNAP